MSDVKGMYIGGSPTYFKDETAREFISDIYDETKTYAVDSYCIHENKLYKCTTETTGGFDGSCWKETNMSTEMVDHTTAIDELNKNLGNRKIQCGYSTANHVDFAEPFTGKEYPFVFCTVCSSSDIHAFSVTVYNQTHTGFDVKKKYVNANEVGNANEVFFWLAIG